MLAIYCLTNRVWISFLITHAVLLTALFVNHYKVVFRAEAFKFSDLILAGEAFNITQNYTFDFSFKMFVVTCASIFIFIAVVYAVKNKKTSFLKRSGIFVLDIALMAGLYFGIYQNKALYDWIPSFAGDYNEVSLISNKGLVYSFLNGISQSGYEAPEDYSVSKYYEILDKYEEDETNDYKPNVIAIMSEAFFDMTACDDAEFYPGLDPLPNMKELRKEGVWGDMIVPGFAGSTASTEFEFLSGANISVISESMPSVYNTYIHNSLYCIPQMFKDKGYYALGIHPGHNWFYNRESVYAKMGFDDFITIEDLPSDIKKVNYYAADSETSKLIIDNYEKHLKTSEKPYFSFTVTIQNHGPYVSDETYEVPRYVRPQNMDDILYYTLNNYAEGLYNADELLGDVMDYINTVDKPTYLVFFGDHLPYFDENFTGYSYLGYDINSDTQEALLNKYRIPYIMCANDAAKQYMKDNDIEIMKGKQKLISSNYLSAKFLTYMGISIPKYYQFVNDLSEKISVISPNYYIENGVFTKTLSDEAQQLINDYAVLQYKNISEYSK